ncbi:MAG: hypothetical protein MUQ10_08100 [Anaerolineae bacterium]|nr:hypothetical protein [Anaerolineae bacterium]
MTNHALDSATFPILGWSGPSDAMIRPDVMSGMAEAGFTISHSRVNGDVADIRQALDVAAKSDVRLLLVHEAWHAGDRDRFDSRRFGRIGALIDAIKDHPGLYGYHLRDEPRLDQFPKLAQLHEFIESRDPDHLCYINHFPPIEGWGAPTAEAFWTRYIEVVRPRMLSYDHYPITVASDAEIRAAVDSTAPNVFAQAKLIVKPDFFSCLELLRTLSNAHSLPFWAFTCSVRHGPYPTPTEGHMRFQLMNDLAYGARGLQYFTYAHEQVMVRPDGSTTETWAIAKRINAEIHTLAPVLRTLRNVGVFRTGPLWSGTQLLHRSHLAPLLDCDGDPVTIGVFLDGSDALHLLVVNGSPVDWAGLRLKVNVDPAKQRLCVFDFCAGDGEGAFAELWPADPHNQLVTLAPGEGRLFKVTSTGLKARF